MAECVCEIIMYEWVSKYIYLEYAPCPASQNKKSKKKLYRRGNLLGVLFHQTDLQSGLEINKR